MSRSFVCRCLQRSVALLLALTGGMAQAAEHQRQELGVIPTPQEVIWTDETVTVDAGFVEKNLGDLARSADLSRYVL